MRFHQSPSLFIIQNHCFPSYTEGYLSAPLTVPFQSLCCLEVSTSPNSALVLSLSSFLKHVNFPTFLSTIRNIILRAMEVLKCHGSIWQWLKRWPLMFPMQNFGFHSLWQLLWWFGCFQGSIWEGYWCNVHRRTGKKSFGINTQSDVLRCGQNNRVPSPKHFKAITADACGI